MGQQASGKQGLGIINLLKAIAEQKYVSQIVFGIFDVILLIALGNEIVNGMYSEAWIAKTLLFAGLLLVSIAGGVYFGRWEIHNDNL